MKWAERIGIVVPSLLIFFICLGLSYRTRAEEWWPEFLMMIAGAALSVVIVLKIIEAWSRRERKHRWENVELLIYSRIVEVLIKISTTINTYVKTLDYIITSDKSDEDIKKSLMRFQTVDQFHFIMKMYKEDSVIVHIRQLAKESKSNSIKIHSYLFNLLKTDEGLSKLKNNNNLNSECNIHQIEKIILLINEYRVLIPRIIELSDDEEIALGLQKLEEICIILLSTLRNETSTSNTISVLEDFSLFLNATANLIDLIP